ncbi:MAG: DNA polymerase IV [Candidatus Gracilibacteria bacterium]|nr:DNA polymerase IV [Candidatus Gracilibacteria bacterium]
MLLKKSKKVFIHIDCDSFFASCEILKNPSLKNKFVCVGGDIIVACTYNCKDLGIKTGTPIWEAQKILKGNGVFLNGDHGFYEKISYQIFDYLNDKVLSLEPFSIDEAFCEITGLPELYKISLYKYLKNIQNGILKDIGIPVSIGCAETKIKAKIYSKINKPFGIYIGFNLKQEILLFKELSIKKIPFVGKATSKKLEKEAKTIYDFISIGFWSLKEQIGKSATDLRLELVGINAFLLKKSDTIKSMSRTRSFNHNLNSNKIFLTNQLKEHFERLFENLIEKNLETKTISLLLRTKDFKTLIFDYQLQEHTNDRFFLFSKLFTLFEINYNKDTIYRSTGVIFGKLKNYLPEQKNIFENISLGNRNNYTLYKTIENINNKYGNHKISFGTSLLGVGEDLKLGIKTNKTL